MDRDVLLSELVRDEAIRLKPYRCSAGKLTIGIGRNLDDKGITEREARYLAENDVDEVVAELDRRVPWWSGLTDARQRVLVNMAFNLGVQGLLGFKNTLALVKAGAYAAAAEAMLDSLWARQVGVGTEAQPGRARRLANLMRQG